MIPAVGFVCSTWQWGWSEHSDPKLRFMALTFVWNRVLSPRGLSYLTALIAKKPTETTIKNKSNGWWAPIIHLQALKSFSGFKVACGLFPNWIYECKVSAGCSSFWSWSDMRVCVLEQIQQTAQWPPLHSTLFFLWLPNQGMNKTVFTFWWNFLGWGKNLICNMICYVMLCDQSSKQSQLWVCPHNLVPHSKLLELLS